VLWRFWSVLIDVRIFKQKVFAATLAAVALRNVIHYPIALCAPLYLQNVLGSSAMAAGLMLAVLPLSTALASLLSGRLADRFDPGTVASTGLVLIFIGIACYSRLGTGSSHALVIVALSLIGAGIGIFTPANQKVAFASVEQKEYGVLAAMLSSFGTAAGTIGTAIAVALMEIDGGELLWREPEIFAKAQRFAFACLAPIGLVAFLIARKSQRGVQSALSL
jgi:MFS family permease